MRTVEHPLLHLHAGAGQPLAIELDGAPAAGLLWQPPAAPPGCTLRAAGTSPAGAGVGGPVRQAFEFTASRAGEWTLRFELRRSWETTPQAVQSLQVTVT